jgi:hypothetical protein
MQYLSNVSDHPTIPEEMCQLLVGVLGVKCLKRTIENDTEALRNCQKYSRHMGGW